jgi:hypothetical protein
MKRALLLCSLLLAPAAHAGEDGFRCGNRLVTQGDHMLEVRKKCGEPDFVSQRTDERKVKAKVRHFSNGQMVEVGEEETIDVLVEQWTYDLGPRRFIRYVDFENARVARVTTGNYGTRAEN